MDRIDVFIKTAFALLGAIFSWLVGGLGLAFVVLLGLMVIDFATGMMAASVKEGLKSSTGKAGLKKKGFIILLIGAVYLLQKLIPSINALGYAGDGIAIAYGVLEFLSILENGGKLGVPLGPVKNIIAILKPRSPEDQNKGDAA